MSYCRFYNTRTTTQQTPVVSLRYYHDRMRSRVIHYSRINWIRSIFSEQKLPTQAENHGVKSISHSLLQNSCLRLPQPYYFRIHTVALLWQPWGQEGRHARASRQHLRRVPENTQHTDALCYKCRTDKYCTLPVLKRQQFQNGV
jgi:hypothetical protein